MSPVAFDILRSSHILLPGVGRLTERHLWQRGVLSLDDFLAVPRLEGFSPARKRKLDAEAQRALADVEAGAAGALAARLPHGEAWRLFERFAERSAYLDIETDGLSRLSAITVVGIYRPDRGFASLVRGQGLTAAALTSALEDAPLVITFNGASFDLPFIRSAFPSASLPRAHLDLLSCARRLAWRGGLKAIERDLGILRDLETRVLAGADAVRLWRAFKRTGSTNALRLLASYNQSDCQNLLPVGRAMVSALLERTRPAPGKGPRQAALPAA